jgi:type I restriction enzyme S subunit
MFGDPTSNPKGWAILPLGEIVDEFRYGTSNKSEGVGKPALRIPNVIGGTLDLIELKTVPVDDAEFRRLRLEDGDLLFVRTNGNQDNVGRCAVFDRKLVEGTGYSPDDFIFASYLIRARFARTKYDPIFLREFLLSSEGRRQLKRLSKTSAGQFNVNTESLGAIRVIQPPILSQQVFRRSVDTVGKLRTRYSTGLEVMNLQFESLQHRAFQGEL